MVVTTRSSRVNVDAVGKCVPESGRLSEKHFRSPQVGGLPPNQIASRGSMRKAPESC
jgi:hypothetical protein